MDFRTHNQVPLEQMIEVAKLQGQAAAGGSGLGAADSILKGGISGMDKGMQLSDAMGKIMDKKAKREQLAKVLASPEAAQLAKDNGVSVDMLGMGFADNSEGLMKAIMDNQTKRSQNGSEPLYYTNTITGETSKADDPNHSPVTEVPKNAKIIQLNAQNQNIDMTDDDRKNLMPLARAVVEGRATPAQMVNARGMGKQKISMLAAEIDPNFDFTQMPARQKLRNDYTTNGTMGKALTSLNTVIGHLDTLDDAAGKLNNKEIIAYNNVGNWISRNTGKPEVTNFNAARNLVVGELGKIAQGTGVVTNEERDKFEADLNNAGSLDQLHGVVDTYMNLIKSRTDAIKSNWQQTFPNTEPPIPFINGKAKEKLIKHGYDPVTLEKVAKPESGPQTKAASGNVNGVSYTIRKK